MARAAYKPAVTKIVVTEEETVTLIMSRDEADTLRDACEHIGGRRELSRRRYFEAIADALDKVGITSTGYNDINESTVIHFKVMT